MLRCLACHALQVYLYFLNFKFKLKEYFLKEYLLKEYFLKEYFLKEYLLNEYLLKVPCKCIFQECIHLKYIEKRCIKIKKYIYSKVYLMRFFAPRIFILAPPHTSLDPSQTSQGEFSESLVRESQILPNYQIASRSIGGWAETYFL